MDISIEHLENHKVQLTVQVASDLIETARRNTAKRLAKDLRIPGFRPGKAPYDVVVQYMGNDALTYEALEDITNDIYKQALEETGIDPYAPGEVKDIKLEDDVKVTFVLPKRPEVELGDYRNYRLEFETPEVTDKDIDKSMALTRENLALAETADRAAQFTDQVVIDVHGFFINEDEAAADAEETEEKDASADDEEAHDHDHDEHDHHNDSREAFIDQHQYEYILLDEPERDLAPNFSAELVGLSAGDEKSFTLSFPADEKDKDLAGRSVEFHVKVNEVKSLIMPANDDFLAELASDGELKTLGELRERVAKQLAETFENQSNDSYGNKVLTHFVENAQISYPEETVSDFIDDLMQDMDQFMREQVGLRLEDYIKVANETMEGLREQNRERAIERMRRSLVLSKIAELEEIQVRQIDLDAEISKLASMFGGSQLDVFRRYLSSEGVYERLASNIITERTLKQLVEIAKGNNPPKGSELAEEVVTSVAAEDADENDEADSSSLEA